MVTQRCGALVAQGNTSDVYDWGRTSVVKVLRPGIPAQWAEREATTTQLVRSAGLPAPHVEDIVTIDERPGIVFERIEGVSMWDRMEGEPQDISELSRLLARLQDDINATPAPEGMPSLHDRLRTNVADATRLNRAESVRANHLLSGLPEGTSVCHFDMHPNNVLLTKRGPIVIDWFDAAAGDRSADIVRSSVLMRSDAYEAHLGGVEPSTVRRFHDAYISWIAQNPNVDEAALLRWEPAVLAARLAEPLIDDVLAATHRALRRPKGESTLFEALQSASIESGAG